MGTNYYWHASGERVCPHCQRETPSLHVGKSSAGWCFSLRIHPGEGIHDLPGWVARWKSGGAIYDEYGTRVSPEEMLSEVTERAGRYNWTDEDLRRNHATRGPNGLARHGYGDVRAGDGTYDLCDFEFS